MTSRMRGNRADQLKFVRHVMNSMAVGIRASDVNQARGEQIDMCR